MKQAYPTATASRRSHRPRTGARIETAVTFAAYRYLGIAPARGRGLKLSSLVLAFDDVPSPPHGGAD